LSLPKLASEQPDPERPKRAIEAACGAAICQSADLLRGDRLYIRHGEETYVLRLTKSGKLLLTK
jgi:hemin uptake protein HemP